MTETVGTIFFPSFVWCDDSKSLAIVPVPAGSTIETTTSVDGSRAALEAEIISLTNGLAKRCAKTRGIHVEISAVVTAKSAETVSAQRSRIAFATRADLYDVDHAKHVTTVSAFPYLAAIRFHLVIHAYSFAVALARDAKTVSASPSPVAFIFHQIPADWFNAVHVRLAAMGDAFRSMDAFLHGVACFHSSAVPAPFVAAVSANRFLDAWAHQLPTVSSFRVLLVSIASRTSVSQFQTALILTRVKACAVDGVDSASGVAAFVDLAAFSMGLEDLIER